MSAASHACQIPVFRYALERWKPAAYEVVVYRDGPLDPASTATLARLTEKTAGNLVANEVDLGGKVPRHLTKIWQEQSAAGAKTPWVVIRYPDDLPGKPIWAGKPGDLPLAKLSTSPARDEVARRLILGQSAVFVLVESGNREADDAAAKLLDEQLRKREKELVLPDLRPDEPGPRLLSELPLKLQFSSLRISRDDPAEALFAAMLTHEVKPEDAGKPVVIPMFGQGRALCTLVGDKEIEAQSIGNITSFLIGACSCQVKELNPGFDVLMSADWAALVEGRQPEWPTMEALPVVAQTATSKPTTRPDATKALPTTVPTLAESTPVEPPYVAAASISPAGVKTAQRNPSNPEQSPTRSWLYAGAAGALFAMIAFGTLAVRRKSKTT